METDQLEEVLCQEGKEVTWTERTTGTQNFHGGAMQPKWVHLFKLICYKLIPNYMFNLSHTPILVELGSSQST